MRKLALLFLFTFFISLNAATFTEDFESGLNGWTTSEGSLSIQTQGSDVLDFQASARNTPRYFEKTYILGAEANSTVTITYDAWATGGWENSSSSNVDFVYASINNVVKIDRAEFPGVDGSSSPVYNSYSISGDVDANGNLVLRLGMDVSSTGEHLQIDNIVIDYTPGPAKAADDSFDTSTNTPLTENLLTNDSGTGLFIVSLDNTASIANGSITSSDFSTGEFTYTPNVGFEGTEIFTYTIEDASGNQSTATVTILVAVVTDYSTGSTSPFQLINPAATRNVRGDYAIAGNTVTCLTSATSGYNPTGACLNDASLTSNNRVNRYIDVDGDSSTWNSSSSYITLPPSYEQSGGKGIAWAGLFWQGRINSDTDYVQHFAQIDSATTYQYIETGDGSGYGTVDISATDANKISLKVGTGSYAPVKASTLHRYASSGGETYAAYADVTDILQSWNLASGKQTFTVANLTTNEGREGSPGLFGGWSLVIIYLQDFNGTPRNISVYNGFDIVANPSTAIPITGFKLPISGTVRAQIGIFSGEGEALYSPDSISMSGDGVSYDPMPNDGSFDSNNVFDAKLTGIDRDIDPDDTNVFSINNTGVDVDAFDVSTLVTGYRDTNPAIDTMYIRWSSGGDYITPSMMVFSTELYQPSVCYDYTYDFDGFVFPSENSDVNTTFQNLGIPLTTHLTIRSIEGDFDLDNTIVTVNSDPAYLTYEPGSAAYAGNSINLYTAMVPPELNVTSINNFRMSIGSNAGATGGTIHPLETHYLRFNHDLNSSQKTFDTRLNVSLDYTSDFGSGPVPIHANLTSDDRCTGYTAYRPEWGIFNVIDGDAANINTYNLKTQVTKRKFNAKAVGYGGVGFKTAQNFNTDVEVEVFNVGIYGTDTNVSCNNPDSNISAPTFVRFNNTSEALMPDISYDRANQNSGFRIWYLEDRSGNLINHLSGSTIPGADEGYFEALYPTAYPGDGNCTIPCTNGTVIPECYTCMKTYYGKPLCSRDNFSIRPENFKISILDNAENTAGTGTYIGDNNGTTERRVVGGYKYQLDLTATNFGNEDPAKGYVQEFPALQIPSNGIWTYDEDRNHTSVILSTFVSNPNCNDTNDSFQISRFWDGKAGHYDTVIKNVGEYIYHILDTKWTFVDNPGNFGQDCINANADVPVTGTIGCNVSSKMDAEHQDLVLRSYPYQFDTSGITVVSPALASGYMYSNQLDANASDTNITNMSLNFQGLINAQGKDASAMTNFVTGCYSENLKLDLDYTLTGEDQNGVTWTDINGTLAEGNPIRWRELNASLAAGTFPLPMGRTETMGAFPDVNLTSTEFSKSQNGATFLNLYLNIDRNVTTPHNPMQASFNSFQTSCENGKCDAIADQNLFYSPKGTYINPTPTMNIFYGRAHTPRYRVQGDSATLRTYYEVYCINCNIPRLQLVSPNQLLGVDDVRWYQNTIHTQTEGELPLAKPMSTQNPAQSANMTNLGINRNTTSTTTSDFTYNGTKGYPYKATINYIPNPWLVYDRYDNTAILNSFELEFFQTGTWVGQDRSGMQADSNASSTTNRRIEW